MRRQAGLRAVWRLLPVAACGLLWSASASAVELPRYDVAAFCLDRGSGTAEQAKCRQAEQDKRDVLVARWQSIPEKRRHVCVQKVQFLKKPQRSYTPLHACLADDLTS